MVVVNVMAAGLGRISPGMLLVKVTTTSAVGRLPRVTVVVAVVPSSAVTRPVVAAMRTAVASWSAMVMGISVRSYPSKVRSVLVAAPMMSVKAAGPSALPSATGVMVTVWGTLAAVKVTLVAEREAWLKSLRDRDTVTGLVGVPNSMRVTVPSPPPSVRVRDDGVALMGISSSAFVTVTSAGLMAAKAGSAETAWARVTVQDWVPSTTTSSTPVATTWIGTFQPAVAVRPTMDRA